MKKRVLFVCSQNRMRSPTAEYLYSERGDLFVWSVGTQKDARRGLDTIKIEDFDLLIAMERSHVQDLKRRKDLRIEYRQILCLDIPDDYDYLEPSLLKLLEGKLQSILGPSGRRLPTIVPGQTLDCHAIRALRFKTELGWRSTTLDEGLYGFQFQRGTRWITGMTIEEIERYESAVGFEFTEEVRYLFSQLNGTDKPTRNLYGNSGEPHRDGPGIYSFPRDIELVRNMLIPPKEIETEWEFNFEDDDRLLPFYGHHYILMNSERQTTKVVSIVGCDGIVYGENLREYFENEFKFQLTSRST